MAGRQTLPCGVLFGIVFRTAAILSDTLSRVGRQFAVHNLGYIFHWVRAPFLV